MNAMQSALQAYNWNPSTSGESIQGPAGGQAPNPQGQPAAAPPMAGGGGTAGFMGAPPPPQQQALPMPTQASQGTTQGTTQGSSGGGSITTGFGFPQNSQQFVDLANQFISPFRTSLNEYGDYAERFARGRYSDMAAARGMETSPTGYTPYTQFLEGLGAQMNQSNEQALLGFAQPLVQSQFNFQNQAELIKAQAEAQYKLETDKWNFFMSNHARNLLYGHYKSLGDIEAQNLYNQIWEAERAKQYWEGWLNAGKGQGGFSMTGYASPVMGGIGNKTPGGGNWGEAPPGYSSPGGGGGVGPALADIAGAYSGTGASVIGGL